MVEKNTPNCTFCERTNDEVPLFNMDYQGTSYWICPEHLPVLIHNPQRLQGRLPGVEKLAGHQH